MLQPPWYIGRPHCSPAFLSFSAPQQTIKGAFGMPSIHMYQGMKNQRRMQPLTTSILHFVFNNYKRRAFLDQKRCCDIFWCKRQGRGPGQTLSPPSTSKPPPPSPPWLKRHPGGIYAMPSYPCEQSSSNISLAFTNSQGSSSIAFFSPADVPFLTALRLVLAAFGLELMTSACALSVCSMQYEHTLVSPCNLVSPHLHLPAHWLDTVFAFPSAHPVRH